MVSRVSEFQRDAHRVLLGGAKIWDSASSSVFFTAAPWVDPVGHVDTYQYRVRRSHAHFLPNSPYTNSVSESLPTELLVATPKFSIFNFQFSKHSSKRRPPNDHPWAAIFFFPFHLHSGMTFHLLGAGRSWQFYGQVSWAF